MELSIYSRQEMEARLLKGELSHTAVISFYDPPAPRDRHYLPTAPIDYSGKCAHVFYVAAHDLDPEALEDYGIQVEDYLPEAPALARFIKDAIARGLVLICQCEYGQSRSAACAAAILQYYEKRGIDIFADYRYYPNQLVYHKIYDALTEGE